MSVTVELLAYARGERSLEAVTRTLIAYDQWIVPIAAAVTITGRDQFERAQILSHDVNMPSNELWVYSDDRALQTAIDAGVRIGTCVRPVHGDQLFGALARLDVRAIKVNMGGPTEQAWFIGADAFALIALWAQALAVERALTAPASPERTATLKDFPGYLLLFFADHDAVATAPGAGGISNPAMLFTALDCCQKVHDRHPQLQRRTWSGDQLAQHLAGLGIDGVVINALGPGPILAFDLPSFLAMLG